MNMNRRDGTKRLALLRAHFPIKNQDQDETNDDVHNSYV